MVRILRTSLCLLLALLLIFHVSPLRADAAAVSAGVAVGVGIGLAVAVGLQALGIRQGTDGAAFSSLVSDCVAALSPEWAIDGLITMLALTNDGVTRTYASRDFLQSILDWLFDSGSLSSSEKYVIPFKDYALDYYYEMAEKPFHCFAHVKDGSEWYAFGGTSPFVIEPYSDGSGCYWVKGGGDVRFYKFYYYGDYAGFGTYSGIGGFDLVLESALVTDLTTSLDLTLESVGQNLDSDYAAYMSSGVNSADAGVSFEDDPSTDRDESENNNQPWLPATIPSLNIGDYTDQSQADAQSGLTSGTIIDDLISSKPGVDVEPGSILDWLSKIWDTIIGLPAAIAQAIAQVLADIFVPSADFVTAKVEAIQARFDWITPIIDFAKSFQSAISGSEPPIIYVHLQNYEGPYNFGGTVKFLDMTWYSRYKSQGDAIISGFLWALLGWHLFMKLPGIINGAGGAVGSITYGRGKDD